MAITNCLILAKGEKGVLRDKRATPKEKVAADTKGLPPAGMHNGEAREWGSGVQPG